MKVFKIKSDNKLDEDLRYEQELHFDTLAKLIKTIDTQASVKVLGTNDILISTIPNHMANIQLVLQGAKEKFWATSDRTIIVTRK
jgi:hypothetical protein